MVVCARARHGQCSQTWLGTIRFVFIQTRFFDPAEIAHCDCCVCVGPGFLSVSATPPVTTLNSYCTVLYCVLVLLAQYIELVCAYAGITAV